MTPVSATHLVLIPSYNPGRKVIEVVREAARYWQPVWVVVDGSTDGSTQALQALAAQLNAGAMRVLVFAHNRGKGAAILAGLEAAASAGFTHVLTMDADGQHNAQQIEAFMRTSLAAPDALVLGEPVFGAEAPRVRVYGRKICNWWVNVETLWAGIGDSLFGFRVYPIAPLRTLMATAHWMRRFDFDAEAAVRLCWAGVPVLNLPSPVRYFRLDQGGVSHFQYGRDNLLLIWMHLRLLAEFVCRLPWLIAAAVHRGRFRSSRR